MDGTTSPPTQRVVETLRALALGPHSHSDVARRVGMSPATTHAVLAELVACGWVHRDPDSRLYSLGPGLLAWATSLVRPESRIHDAVQALAAALDRPVLFGQLNHTHDLGPTLMVRDTSAFITAPRYQSTRSIQMPFAAPFGSVIAAHVPDDLQTAWLPRDEELVGHFRAKLDDVVRRGYSVESYGPRVIQLLSLLRASVSDFGRDGTAALAEDLQHLIARADRDQPAQHPTLVSVPVEIGDIAPGSLTVQLRRSEDSPEAVVPVLRQTALQLEGVLRST